MPDELLVTGRHLTRKGLRPTDTEDKSGRAMRFKNFSISDMKSPKREYLQNDTMVGIPYEILSARPPNSPPQGQSYSTTKSQHRMASQHRL